MHEFLPTFLTIAAIGVVTMITRATPYVIFGGKRGIPGWVAYLGSSLPPAIMVILVVYCLGGTDVSSFPHGLPELISLAVVAVLQYWKKNTILSILAGTICYMALIRTVFPL